MTASRTASLSLDHKSIDFNLDRISHLFAGRRVPKQCHQTWQIFLERGSDLRGDNIHEVRGCVSSPSLPREIRGCVSSPSLHRPFMAWSAADIVAQMQSQCGRMCAEPFTVFPQHLSPHLTSHVAVVVAVTTTPLATMEPAGVLVSPWSPPPTFFPEARGRPTARVSRQLEVVADGLG